MKMKSPPAEMAQFIEREIKAFVRTSPLNRMPASNDFIFDEPLVQFADGDDPLFAEYKTIIDSTHLTPREALAKAYNKSPKDVAERLSVISWVMPFTEKTRKSNRRQTDIPSRYWILSRNYGEKFNDALREHVVKLLTGMGYLTVAPVLQPYFKKEYANFKNKGYFSTWSERHIAYAAGLGTFSLSDGLITERGIAHRCGSAVASLMLPASPRTARDLHSNCLFYANGKCGACIKRCPAGAITEKGHDKLKCRDNMQSKIPTLIAKYNLDTEACGLCQTKVPCEDRNPVKKVMRRG